MILKLVKEHGTRKWSLIAESLTGRSGKQCRERCDSNLGPPGPRAATLCHPFEANSRS